VKIETRYTWEPSDIKAGVKAYFSDGIGFFMVGQYAASTHSDAFLIIDRFSHVYSTIYTAKELANDFTARNLAPKSPKAGS